MALDKTVKILDPGGTVINITRQILACADDIAIIARNVYRLEEVFGELEREGRNMGLLMLSLIHI